jgi:hypothetical protein
VPSYPEGQTKCTLALAFNRGKGTDVVRLNRLQRDSGHYVISVSYADRAGCAYVSAPGRDWSTRCPSKLASSFGVRSGLY